MHRSLPSRIVILAVGVGLLAASLVSPVLGADTRTVFVGSPGVGGGDGVLTLSPVSAGQATKTDIRIANDSQATMNKTTLTIGTAPAATPLPAGVTVFGAYGPNGSACIVAAGGASVTCSFGNVRSGTERNVTIVFEVASAGSVTIEAAVKVKETVNDNGANKDTFFAAGAVAVGAFSCDSVATFVAPGQGKTVSTQSACDPQSTALTIPALGSGALVSIQEVADASCSGSLTCFGQASVANVNDGAAVNLTWAITWNNAVLPNGFNPRKAGVLHFLDDGETVVVIANTNAGKCGNSPSRTNCVVSVVESATTTTITFRTPSNGRVKGFG